MTNNAKELLSKYIQNTEQVFAEIKISRDAVYIDREKIREIIDVARRYLEDARYYRDRKRFETGLASVAYCEGLLDALRLLGGVNFSW
jgi:FAD synthetase